MNRLLYIISFSFLSFAATGRAGSYIAYSTKEGMPDNYISCLLLDRMGYLWAGTNSGLVRYDGYTFRVYKHNPRDTNSVNGNTITCLYEDRDGKIWIGTYNKGLSCYNPFTGRFTNYIHKETDSTTIGQNTVYSIYRDSHNRLWFGLAGKGIDRLDEAKRRFVHHTFMGHSIGGANRYANIIRDIQEDSRGNLWMCSQYGLHWRDAATGNMRTIRAGGKEDNTHYTSLYMENDTSFWLGTWAHGLRHLNPATGAYKDYLCNKPDFARGTTNIISVVLHKSDHEFWVSSYDSGFGIYNKSAGKFVKHKQILDGEAFTGLCVLPDKTGNLWIGTERHGLVKYPVTQNLFENYSMPGILSYPERMGITQITADNSGRYYLFPVFGRGVMIANADFSKVDCINVPHSNNNLFSVSRVLHDSRNRIWMNANGSLVVFHPADKSYKPIHLTANDGVALSYAHDMDEDSKGNIWFCNSKGIFRYGPDNTLRHFVPRVHDKDILNDMHTMYIDRQNNIWICNSFYGLARYIPGTNRLENYMPVPGDKQSISQSSLMNIVQDEAGTYWIATMGNGVCRMKLNKDNRPVFFDFSGNDKLDDVIMDIGVDKAGNIWISDKEKIHAYLHAENKLISFDESTGLSTSYRGGNIFADSDGSVLFGAFNQVQRISASKYMFNQYVAPVVLTSFRVNGEPWLADTNINFLKKIKLNYNQNFISFEAAALNYSHTESNIYAYKLEGLDDKWNYSGTRRYASYTGIRPGNYTLRVKAANNDNVWNNEGIALSIFIAPPFWQTWWFYALVAMVFMLVTIAVYRYRVKVVKERERIKSEFNKKVAEVEMTALRAQMNPHFLFNCLNSINKYVLMNDRDATSEYLTSFAKLIRLILDNSKQESVTLENELEALALYIDMEALRFENLFEYKIEVADDIIAEDVYVPPLLFQPFVENAIWHGLMHKDGPGLITIKVQTDADRLIVSIEDNGVGRAKAKEYEAGQTLKRKSHGMQITGERISILNKLNNSDAVVEIIDLADEQGNAKGTRVRITLPMLYTPTSAQQDTNTIKQ